jgi:hypothetical protein
VKPNEKTTIDYAQTNEPKRLNEARETGIPWMKWGAVSLVKDSGAPSAKTTVWTGMRGAILVMTNLLNLYQFYGDDFKVECPSRSGKYLTLFEIEKEITQRLESIFLRDASGNRPVYGGTKKFQEHQHWKDYITFYEYFHEHNGAGLGASHQTGWTGVIARSIDLFAPAGSVDWLKLGKGELAAKMTRAQVAGKRRGNTSAELRVAAENENIRVLT